MAAGGGAGGIGALGWIGGIAAGAVVIGVGLYMSGALTPDPDPAPQAVVQPPDSPSDTAQTGEETAAVAPAPQGDDTPSDRPVEQTPAPGTPAEDTAPETPAETATPSQEGEAADTAGADALPELLSPSFDLVRVEPDGTAVIAGKATSGSTVTLLVDRVDHDSLDVDSTGSFVIFAQLPPSTAPRLLSLRASLGDRTVLSEDEIILAPSPAPAPEAQEVAAATPSTDEAGTAPAAGTTEADASETAPAGSAAQQPATSAAVESTDSAPAEDTDGPRSDPTQDALAQTATTDDPGAAPSDPAAPSETAEAPATVSAEPPAVSGTEAPPSADTTEAEAPASQPAQTAETEAPVSQPAQTAETEAAASQPAQTTEAEAPASQPARTAEAEAPASQPAQTAETEAPASQPAQTAEATAPAGTEETASPPTGGDAPAETAAAPAAEPTPPSQPAAPADTADAPVAAPAADPAPVAVIRSGAEGVELVQPATPTPPELRETITLETISYSDAGDVLLSGRTRPGAAVRVYLDNAAISDFASQDDGRWKGRLTGITPGVYTLRLDALDATGKVLGRVETPFKREAPELLAAQTAPRDPATGERLEDTPPIRAVTVQKGDTLWAISRERYGEPLLYVKVFEANRDQIRDPDLIYPGQVFAMPDVAE